MYYKFLNFHNLTLLYKILLLTKVTFNIDITIANKIHNLNLLFNLYVIVFKLNQNIEKCCLVFLEII